MFRMRKRLIGIGEDLRLLEKHWTSAAGPWVRLTGVKLPLGGTGQS